MAIVSIPNDNDSCELFEAIELEIAEAIDTISAIHDESGVSAEHLVLNLS